MSTKICTQCNREHPIEHFSWRNKKKGYRQSGCKTCDIIRQRRYYDGHKQQILDKNKRQTAKQKEWYRNYKKTLKCERCPEDHPACLDFHHIDENNKTAEISRLIYSSSSIKRLKEEIEKCIVLCSNCHRKVHWKG